MINASVILTRRVLVFKTSVKSTEQVESLRPDLNNLMAENEKWNFDLEDCDHILRVESHFLSTDAVRFALISRGHQCEELPD